MSEMRSSSKATYLCIGCPVGCQLMVELPEGADDLVVSGQQCRRGVDYARKEHRAPERFVTASVRIQGAAWARLPVKTQQPVPKESVVEVCRLLREVTVEAPVVAGDVILANVAGSGVDVVATRSLTGSLSRADLNEVADVEM